MTPHRTCRTAFGVCVALSSLIPTTGSATGLDDAAPAKAVTVRSEIARGHEAQFDCAVESGPRWLAFDACVDAVVSQERLKNTDTDAFLLGVYFGSYINLEIIRSIPHAIHDPASEAAFTAAETAYRSLTADLRAKLRLSDEQLADATKMDYETAKKYLK